MIRRGESISAVSRAERTQGLPAAGRSSQVSVASDQVSIQRIAWIDVVKGSCIFLVVLHHFVKLVLPAVTGPDPESLAGIFAHGWLWFDGLLGPLRMPLFFFVSGLLIHQSTRRERGEKRRNRLDNLLWMYLLFSVIQWLSTSALHQISGTTNQAPLAVDAIYAESILGFARQLGLGNASLWYLYALALYYLFCRTFNQHRIAGTTLAVSAYLVLYLSGLDLGWGPNGLIHNLPWFLLAMYWGPTIITRMGELPRTYPFLTVVTLSCLTLYTASDGYSYRFVGSMAAMLTAVYVIAHYGHQLNRRRYQWLATLGQQTLFIYLFHRIAIEALFLVAHAIDLPATMLQPGWLAAWTLLSPVVATAILCVLCARVGQYLKDGLPSLFVAPRIRSQPEHHDRFA